MLLKLLGPSKGSGLAVKPSALHWAASTAFLAASPAWKGLVMVPKLMTLPLVIDRIMPSARAVSSPDSPRSLQHAAAAPKLPMELVGCQPPMSECLGWVVRPIFAITSKPTM